MYVMAFGTGLLKERMEIAKRLWDAGIKTEFSWKVKPKLPQQFKAAEVNGVPFAVILGEDELKKGECKIKELGLEEGHPEKDGVVVKMERLEQEVKERISRQKGMNLVEGVNGVKLEDAPQTS